MKNWTFYFGLKKWLNSSLRDPPHQKTPNLKKIWKNQKFEEMRGFIKKIKLGMFKEVLRVPSKFFLYVLDNFRVLSLSGSFATGKKPDFQNTE